jgi:hypothetical protein
VLYVELVDPTGDVIEKQKLKIIKGQANGEIKLDKLFVTGFYEVRAYTRYMTNWGKDGVFSRVFPVFRQPTVEGDYSHKVIDEVSYLKRLPDYRERDSVKTRHLNVKFYPEGGRLVEGLSSVVAFDVTNESGAHVVTSGWMTNGNDTIYGIKTIREGRGMFSYTPSTSPMVLYLKDKFGKICKFPLPPAEKSGFVMSVDSRSASDITLRAHATKEMENEVLGIAVLHNGKILLRDTVSIASDGFFRTLSRKRFEDGVNQIVVINGDGKILADRLVFVYPRHNYNGITVKAGKDHLDPCSKMDLDIHTVPNTTFSLSVSDFASQPNGYGQNAATWLLLTSDLKGFIENPSYYLEKDDETHRMASDLLMLVQGWRRYDFKMMEGKSMFVKRQPIEDCLYIDGQLHQAKKKNGVDNVDLSISLYNLSGDILNGYTTTNKNGYYAFNVPDCYNEWILQMQTQKNDKNLKYYVAINRNFSPEKRHLSYYETQPLPVDTPRIFLSDGMTSEANMSMTKDIHNLKGVSVKGHRIYRNFRAVWENEARGAKKAGIH